MIKKIFLLATFSLAALVTNAQVICTPDPAYANAAPGIYPDSLDHAYSGQEYNMTITIRTLCDTSVTFQGIPVALSVKALKILDVTGCVKVHADEPAVTAAAVNVYPLTVYVDVLATGNPIPSSPTWVSTLGTPPYGSAIAFSDYVLKVDGPTATIETAPTDRFWVGLNYPNPANGNTNIAYNVAKKEAVGFKVYNMLGALVYSNNYQADNGKNTISFDTSKLSSGMYVYTVTNGKQTITRKMTIN